MTIRSAEHEPRIDPSLLTFARSHAFRYNPSVTILRYMLVGGFAGSVDLALFALLVKGFGLPWFGCAALTFCIATTINYLLSIRFVFDSGARFRRHHEVALIFVVSAIGLAIHQSALWLLVQADLPDILVAKLLASATAFAWNYSARRYFVFRRVAAR